MTELMQEKPKRKKRREGLTETGQLTKVWSKFISKTRDLSEPIHKWTQYQLLGYICKRYLEIYNTPYSFSFKGAPTKSEEMFHIRKIIFNLDNDNPRVAKEYIDFVFDKKVIPQKRRITSLGFFTLTNLINEFKITHAKSNKITRSTPLPKEYISLAQEKGIEANTYSDLAFIKLSLDSGAEGLEVYKDYFNALLGYCFDPKILDTLED